ncbi:ImmA/IrrE family metallo-endopeptidase [Nonomuraea sp. NPDC050790]|uniref:ImmA/IrrE family metallo-endopeptidase n=1 Tax=Nonomuraea sp. NPDC050790 TaxID=3364371 RepID=UPI0037B638F0
MNRHPSSVIADLRALMPSRPLENHEAEGVAERQAKRFLEIFEITDPGVDVGLIAELPRIRVRVAPSLPESGLTYWDRGVWVIGVNRDDSRTRRRFTLAHEFKHILDHPFIDRIYGDTSGKPSDKRAELLCDHFAACLLMPRPWVKRLWTQETQDVRVLAATFNVSPAAMSLRLQHLGLVEQHRRWRVSEESPVRHYFRDAPVQAMAISTAG